MWPEFTSSIKLKEFVVARLFFKSKMGRPIPLFRIPLATRLKKL
jgi:hypothetical protein